MQSVKAMIALTRKKEIATSAINILEIEDITEEGGYKHPVISVLMNCTAAEYVILKDRLYKNIKPYIIGSIVPTEDEIKEFAL